ncbi:MAG: hypothetical protein NT076_03990 [Candidatus Pacearchaeota archaeon]|nr:hypothetical protein [Candidatus Pacearchaeota archaeon]
MGKIKHITKIEEFISKTPVFNLDSIKRLVKDYDYAKLLVHNLEKKGKIKRLTKGFYSIYNDSSLIVFCFKPAYLGLQDALSFHGLWEQETIPVVITSKKVRTGLRNYYGTNVLIKRLDKKYLFGFEYKKQGDFYLPYSDIEKTFIDLVYFRISIDKEVIKEIKRRIDMKKLKSYLKAYPKKTRERVLRVLGIDK